MICKLWKSQNRFLFPADLPDPFWLDTYFDNETGQYRFSHSKDLVSEFDFIQPMVSLFSN